MTAAPNGFADWWLRLGDFLQGLPEPSPIVIGPNSPIRRAIREEISAVFDYLMGGRYDPQTGKFVPIETPPEGYGFGPGHTQGGTL